MDVKCFLDSGPRTKVKVVAGDVASGNWELRGSRLTQPAVPPKAAGESVDLAGNIRRLDLKDMIGKDNFEPFVGAGIGALLGFRILGLLGAAAGALAGHMLTRNGPEVSVTCELKDGRKFIAVMAPETYQQLVSMK